jgi:hypothetical protein
MAKGLLLCLFIDLFVDKKRDWAFWEGGGLES